MEDFFLTLKTTNMKSWYRISITEGLTNSLLMICENNYPVRLDQGELQNLLHGLGVMEFNSFNKRGIYLANIFFILPAEDNFL